MKKVIFTSAIIFLVSSCTATPQDLRSQSPHAVHSSDKNPKDIAMCIAEKWENTKVFGGSLDVDYRPTHNGITITQKTSGNLHYLADIKNTKHGSKTVLYRYKVMSIGGDVTVDAVANCQL